MTNLVELRGGLMVREDALRLVIDLEMRGVVWSATDGRLVAGQAKGIMTTAERQQVKALHWHVLGIVGYQAPEVR